MKLRPRTRRIDRFAYQSTNLPRSTQAVTLALIGLVIVSSFVGRLHFDVLGFRVRLEQVTPLLLATWMLAHPNLRLPFLKTLRHPAVLIYAVFVLWNFASTLWFSPDFSWSASILAWLTIDLLLLMSLMALRAGAEFSFRLVAASVVPWATLGLIFFAAANLTHGAFNFGTAFDWLYEIYVARVTAIEANIFASMLMIWGILSITRRNISWRWIAIQCVVIPLGLLASQTRTAVLSMVGGLFIFALYSVLRDKSALRQRFLRIAPALTLVASLAVVYIGVSAIQPPSAGVGASSSSATVEGSAGINAPENQPVVAGAKMPPMASVAVYSNAPEPTPSPTRDVPDPSNPDTQNKIGDLDLQGGTIAFRITVAKLAAEEMTGVNLWLGNGTNTFGLRHEQPDSPGVTGHIIMLPVQVLYDGGIVGLALLMALLVAVFVCTPKERKPIAAGVLASFLVSATLTSFFWFAMTWILFAVLMRPADGDSGSLSATLRRLSRASGGKA